MGAGTAGQIDKTFEQIVGALRALTIENGFQRLQPFLGFLGIVVGRVGRETNLVKRGH
jgi:hypothetical protein